MFVWLTSNIDCVSVSSNINFDLNQPEYIDQAARIRRKSDFDRGYNEFLKNYHNENDIERHGRYRVQESDENDSNNESSNESSDESVENSSESESEESDEKENEYRMGPQTKSRQKNNKNKNKNKNKNDNQNSNQMHNNKRCKMEKRKNMLCAVCYNPENDEKTESCSYESEPKEHNYAYSEDTTTGLGSKDKELESFESSDENEFVKSKKVPKVKKVYRNRIPHQVNRFYPPYPIRPPSILNYGPQSFVPQPLLPQRGKPIKYQQKNPPPDVTVFRYRTVETPFTSQRIRVIAYPNRSSYIKKQIDKRPTNKDLEMRPPRDTNGEESESLWSNVTKEHQFEYLPSDLGNGPLRRYFNNKGGPKCKKFIEKNKMCFECYVEGERRKECMFTTKPKRFFESFSTSKKFSNKRKPYEFDSSSMEKPQRQNASYKKTKSPSHIRNKNGAHDMNRPSINVSLESTDPDPIANITKQIPNSTDDSKFQQNKIPDQLIFKQQHSVPDIIYGKNISGAEPLYVLEY